MYSTWSRQKPQTLRRRRSKSGMGVAHSEGDVGRGDVAAGGAHGHRFRFRCRRRAGRAVLAAVEELHVGRVDLGLRALLAGLLVLPGTSLQTALDIDEPALLQVLAAQLGQLAI